jgi:uncharacterized membrane protein
MHDINKALAPPTSMKVCIALLFVLLASPAFAATITGTVYTKDLEPAKYSILMINTSPQQRLLIVDGVYEVRAPVGSYRIYALLTEGNQRYEDELDIVVTDEQAYTYDFILFASERNATESLPGIEDDIVFSDLPSVRSQALDAGWVPAVLLIIGLVAAVIVLGQRRWWRTQTAEPMLDADLQSILSFVRKEGGRTTQRELRKQIPCSEAKLSMMLTELEAKGKVQKIKKGRANLIVLR